MDRKLRQCPDKRGAVEGIEGKECEEARGEDSSDPRCAEKQCARKVSRQLPSRLANEYRPKARVCNEGTVCNREASVKPAYFAPISMRLASCSTAHGHERSCAS